MERLPAGMERMQVADSLPSGIERRLVLRILIYWRDLCGDHSYPSFADVDPAAIPDMWESCFVLEVLDRGADPVFRHLGREFAARSPVPLLGRRISAVPRATLAGHAVSIVPAVLDKEAPVSRGGEFVQPDGARVLYRSILLPMSDDGETISGLLGAANCRVAAEES